MNHRYIVVLAALVAVALGTPASAQYMWLDVNGDGQCTTADVLGPSVTSVDVWLDTDSNADGSPAVCVSGDGGFTINSYAIVLKSPTGGVTYGVWTNNMPFDLDSGNGQGTNEVWISWASGTILPAGTYKLGSQAITVTGSPVIEIAASAVGSGTAFTSFGAGCSGNEFDNTLEYLNEWNDVCGTTSATPVTETTWGQIKAIYH